MSYGFFWISLVITLMFPAMKLAAAPTTEAMAWYMFIWGIFTTGMLIATFKRASYMMSILFATVVILFMLLAAHFWAESAGV